MPQNLGFDLPGLASNLITKIWMLQRTYNWQIILPDTIDGIMGILLSQYCQDAKFADYSINELSSLRYGARQRFYAGLPEIGTVTLNFIMPIDNSVYDYFRGWRNLIVDTNGYYHPKMDYKKDVYIFMFDKSGVQSAKFALKGCFPKTCPPINLSYAENDILKWGCELSVDYIETSSLIGSIRTAVTNFAGGIAGNVKNMLGL